jgi:hypothetical protein
MVIHKYNTRLSSGALKRKLIVETSDDSSNASSDGESDDEISPSSIKYYKLLNKLYPSKHLKYKLRAIKKQKLSSFPKKTNKIFIEIKDNNKNKNKNKIITRNDRHRNRDEEDEDYEDYEDEDHEDEDYEDHEDEDEDEDEDEYTEGRNKLVISKNAKKLLKNVFLRLKQNIKKNSYQDDYGYYYDDDDDEESDEDSDEESDEDSYEESDEDLESTSKKKTKKNSKKNGKKNDASREELENTIIDDNSIVPVGKKIANKNYKKFAKILDNDDDGESEYFKKLLSKTGQESAIEKLESLKELTSIKKPYLLHLLELDIPDMYKAAALKKINMLRSMGGGFGNSEFYKIKSWVDAFIKIPFNKYNNLPITFADGIDECHDFMENAKKTLDSVVYGLNDAKIQIMQLIGLWLVNPNACGSAIAIKGPPGTGKTTLIKDGISKILNRPFALIALGGCGDSGFLDGHDYTYEGSKYGKIIDILIKSGCMNPVILFDELDKISDTPKGEEIAGVLTHLTDTTQNTNYTDKYMSEISLDMSKALYIFSYNDEKYVNPILKDRMYKIETQGYKLQDKLVISRDYLIPKICEQTKFGIDDIFFKNEILEYIISDFTDKESGVRNLKRCLETIFTKLNLYRLMKPDINLFESSMDLKEKIEFPITLTRSLVDRLIDKSKHDKIPFGMYN